jgi:hypothetical protein
MKRVRAVMEHKGDIRTDWTVAEVAGLFGLPFHELRSGRTRHTGHTSIRPKSRSAP